MGNLTAVTDAVGNVSAMTYDSLGRKVGMTDPDMGGWSYAYDAAGNLTSQVDGKVQRLCFTYDALNRLTYKRHDSDGNGCDNNDTQLAQYLYYNSNSGDGKVGQPEEIRWSSNDEQNLETFDYDSLGRLTTHIRFVDDRGYTMRYGNFDSLNRPRTITYPSGEIITVNYDREGENSLSSNWGGGLVNNVRTNARGQMTFGSRRRAPDTTYNYFGQTDAAGGGLGDSNFRLRQINSGSALKFSYTYDKVGNIRSITDNILVNTQSFGYDALNRLTTASAPGTASIAGYNHTYGYDVLGNITNNAGINYNYYDTAHKHAVTHLNNIQKFWYDANGNMTKRIEETGTYIQNFDVENRLLSVEMVGNGVTSFAYDASGQRVKTVQPDGRILYTPFPTYEEEVLPVAATTPIVTLTANWQTAVTIPPNTAYALQWQASNDFACEAGGSWSGSKPLNGSHELQRQQWQPHLQPDVQQRQRFHQAAR
ncbi:MAG: RHS repeat protein [bacterium]|nr:RHS repeat protein [bacterium]